MIGDDPSNAVFAISAAVDALVLCGLLAWALHDGQPRGWRGLGRTAMALAAAATLLAIKGVAMLYAGLDRPFGVMHVVWLDLVVVVPLAAALVGLRAWRAGGPGLRAVVVLGLLLAPVGAYASFVEPERLVVERAEIELPGERTGDRAIRVALIADIQFEQLGVHEREAVERVLAERPDLILLSGDYHQGARDSFERQLPEIRDLLSRLRAPAGVFAVQGDSEGIEKARQVFAGTGIRLLLDDHATVRVADRRVSIAGLALRYWSPRAQRLMSRFERAPSAGDVRLLLAHRPDAALDLAPASRIDLVLAGHTHGGQLQIPFVGPPTTASEVPRAVAAGGLHELNGNPVYVSRGIGVERGQAPRLRLGATPEISILELR